MNKFNLKVHNPKWAFKPREELVNHTYLLKKDSVLDLGGSDGVNALYLAQNGFKVTSFDKDTESNDKLQKIAIANQLPIEVIEKDLNFYTIDKTYDNIITFFTLHFLKKENGLRLINEMIKHTNIGGINLITTFTNVGEFEKDDSRFYVKNNELAEIYLENKWNLLFYKKRLSTTKSGKMQERVTILAQNKR